MKDEKTDGKFARIRAVTVFLGAQSAANSVFDDAVTAFARFLTAHDMTLVYGGSNVGTMKLLADTVLAAGGRVVGVFTSSLPSEIAHPGLTELVVAPSLAERKRILIERGDAIVALPGALGTLDELSDALARRRMKSGGHRKPVGVLNVDGYYDHLLAFIEHARETGFASRGAAQILQSGRTPEELFKRIAGNLAPPNPRNG